MRNNRIRPTTERLTEPPVPPEHLGQRATEEWFSLAPLVIQNCVLTQADLRSFELLCETLATETEARETIRQEGMTLATGSGGTRAHPAIRVMEVARSQAANLLRDFGLTPKSRQHVPIAPISTHNPWED